MKRSGSILRRLSALWVRRPLAETRRRATMASLAVENLEGRLVLSHFGGGPGEFSNIAPVVNFSYGNDSGWGGGEGEGFGGGFGMEGGQSSVLGQDAAAVQQAYRTFDSAYLAAVAALRQTGTTTSPPTGTAAFDTAIASAISTLNTSISTDLANLTNTGSGLASTIATYNTTLQSEIDSAATGLANSTNSAVLAMNREVNGYLWNAEGQATSAIRSDSPPGTITGTMLQTYHQAVHTAQQTFASAINSAAQASISTSSTLSSSAVSAAVTPLETSLTSAVGALGLPSATVTTLSTTISTDLTNLTTSLTTITAPTAGNNASAFLFLRTIRMTIGQTEGAITQAVASAVQTYNNGLL